MFRTLLVSGLLIAMALPSAHGGTASLDPSFGAGGIVTTDVFGQGSVSALVVSPDGIVAAGTNNNSAVLARYTGAGVLDPSFVDPNGFGGTAGVVLGDQGSAEAIVRLGDGRLVTGGVGGFSLTRFGANGVPEGVARLIDAIRSGAP